MRNLDDLEITDASRGSAFTVKVVPKSNRTEVVEIMDDGMVKIHLTAPPIGNQINEELIAFLSDLLNIPPEDVEIVAEDKEGRRKLVSVLHVGAAEVDEAFRGNMVE